MIKMSQKISFIKYPCIFLVVILISIFIYYFDMDLIHNWIIENQEEFNKITIITITCIFILRGISIVIPILPGTYCSVIAGYVFGFERGLLLIFFADLLSCSMSFAIAR